MNRKITLILFILMLFPLLFYAQYGNAVLSGGTWYKFAVNNTGIYKITYNELVAKQILAMPVPSGHIAVFGGKGGALPEKNSPSDPMDLQELALEIHDGGDGNFGQGDFILFYAETADRWFLSGNKYEHEANVYADNAYCFISFDYFEGIRNRIAVKETNNNLPDTVFTEFNEKIIIEKDEVNPAKSGREWFGDKVDELYPNLSVEIKTPEIITSKPVKIAMRFVCQVAAELTFTCNGQVKTLTKQPTAGNMYTEFISNENWNLSSENSQMQIRYKKAGDRTLPVYLDYLKIYYQRKLNFINRQMIFSTLGHNNCKNIGFSISNANQNVRIWDIGNQLSPQSVNTVFAGNNLSFVSDSSFTEYIAFSEATTYQIARFLPVANQNLHQLEKIDYVIITYPDFHNEAEQLAEWHRDRGLSVVVAEPEKIYNEFSFGRQDPMGIRKFLRYLRNKAFAQNDMHHAPKYLCLFGGASYDYKNRTNVFKNFVPNYQFPTMLRDDYCLSTDDMYAFLDDGEDGWATFHTQDIAVGRLPVTNIEQAQNVLNKIFTYASPNRIKTTAGAYSNFGDWRNVVTNIADNGTGTDFVGVYEDNVNFESYFKTHYPHINLEKIYIDAFPLEITGSGARAPEAKKVLKQRVERGTLILNYEGHSGEVELGDEHILDISDINAFENYNNLTVLFSASCSFSHYDNPERVSGGEWSMLAPNGFAIASIATTRIAYVYPNYLFHGYWLHRMLDRTNGKAQTLGEAFRLGRNDSQNQYKLRPFVLLGDPALPVALPKYKINTLSINDIPIEEEIDTLKALSQVNIKGNITDFDSNLLDNFNGYITVTIFDKPSVTHTLGQPVSTTQGSAPIFEYYVQKNVIYKGKTKVENGFFSIDFTVPIDIKYNFGNGKISYYAYCDTADAVGVFTDVVIGGFGDSFELVAEAPVVKLFMNDSNFVSGNITNKNPMLLAVVEDKYGINFSGSGIGHDIVMIIDGNSKNPYILNDFFEYVDGYTVGNLTYLLQNLQPGHHKISLKIWNIFNISTLAEIDFVVVEENNLVVGTVYNYPNPVADGTYFYFTHNEPKKINSVEINIFDYIGRKMKTIRKEFTPINSFAIEPIYWDRETDGGQSFGNGLYPYNVIVRCEDGQSKTVSGKLLLK